VVKEEMVINRRVVVRGDPLHMPEIDCGDSIRCFRVVRGGYLELSFVRMRQGGGANYDRITGLSGIIIEEGGGGGHDGIVAMLWWWWWW